MFNHQPAIKVIKNRQRDHEDRAILDPQIRQDKGGATGKMRINLREQSDYKKFPGTDEEDQKSPENQAMHPARFGFLQEPFLPKGGVQSGENSFYGLVNTVFFLSFQQKVQFRPCAQGKGRQCAQDKKNQNPRLQVRGNPFESTVNILVHKRCNPFMPWRCISVTASFTHSGHEY